MIVSTATQPDWLSPEMVGLRSDGNEASSAARFFSAIFIFNPTLVSASSAPWSNIAIVSIFLRFHWSFQAS